MAARTDINKLIGQRFGRLVVVADGGMKSHHSYVLVLCDCGKEKLILAYSVTSGFTKSCGCLHKEITGALRRTHGESRTPLHFVWKNMLNRCLYERGEKYQEYGGRGITVCQEWIDSYQVFRDFAMNNGWKKGLQIDRIDNDGNYQPSNVRFVTGKVNINNSRTLRSKNTTGYRGVSLRENGKYRAVVRISGYPKLNKSGFDSAIDAAVHRDHFCTSLGIQTPLNFPQTQKV